MKNLMLLIGILISLIAKSQFSLQPRVGLNENTHAVFALDIAYRLGCLEPAVVINDVQHNTEAAYFSFRVGYIFPINEDLKLVPIVGRSYRYMSNDKLNENYWITSAGLRVEKHLPIMVDKTAVFVQAEYLKQWQFSVGVKL